MPPFIGARSSKNYAEIEGKLEMDYSLKLPRERENNHIRHHPYLYKLSLLFSLQFEY
jgi:hypothetical protein